MRIKNAPVTVAIPSNPADEELEKDVAVEDSLRADVFKTAEETQQLQQEVARRGLQRDILATMVYAVEQTIQERRQKLDAAKRTDFDLARGLSEAKFQLDQLHRQREQAAGAAAPPVVIESYPTPISRAVDGPEAHLLISNGRVVFVPLEALLEEFKVQAAAGPQATRPAGIDRHGRADRGFSAALHAGASQRFARGDADDRPRGQLRGAAAMGADSRRRTTWASRCDWPDQGSDFRQKLKKILPGRTTITIWVYPDGFDAFREIRRELYRQNYTIAARPLPPASRSPVRRAGANRRRSRGIDPVADWRVHNLCTQCIGHGWEPC